MIACLDVDYRDGAGVAACLLFTDWRAATAEMELVEVISPVAPYVPGEFYRRELPCLLKVLAKAAVDPDAILIDGYVWLGEEKKPGLGAHLYDALERRAAVIGVAKSRFADMGSVREVHRGGSRRPLYVSAAGLDLETAARQVESLHGEHRIPTLLRRVDRLCRALEE